MRWDIHCHEVEGDEFVHLVVAGVHNANAITQWIGKTLVGHGMLRILGDKGLEFKQ